MNSDYVYKKGDSIVYVGFVISTNKQEKTLQFAKVIEVAAAFPQTPVRMAGGAA